MPGNNILYLIGNGFDISAGLRTAYNDILKGYLSNEKPSPQLDFFKDNLNSNFDDWCDFEEQLGKFTEKFDEGNIDNFFIAVRNFREYMVAYLKEEVSKIDYNLLDDNKLKVLRSFIINPYIYFHERTQQTVKKYFFPSDLHTPKYNAISFNYTDVFDKCIEKVSAKTGSINYGRNSVNRLFLKNILHIHGTLNENVIMGVDNDEQIANQALRLYNRLAQRVIKPEVNSALENLINDNVNSFIQTSRIICVFGMSIGKTDMTWWKKIGKWIGLNKDNHLMIFYKHDNDDNIHPEDTIDIINNAKNVFVQRAGNIKDCGEQIHISYKSDLFDLHLVN
jgi:hypothetical protein